jgi:hypothetical protein
VIVRRDTASPKHRQKFPPEVAALFWDIDPQELNLARDQAFLFARILGYGGWGAASWLRRQAGDEALARWILAAGAAKLDPRRLRFWQTILRLPSRAADARVRRSALGIWSARLCR